MFIGNASANLNDCELIQINSTHWYFETTQTDLADGEYNYQAFANNISSDYRILTVSAAPAGNPPAITSWQNDKTLNNTLDFTINTSESVNFNATANQTITTWNWYKDAADQSHNYDNITLNWSTAGLKHVIVNATNANGTSESITWNVTVELLEEYIQEQIQFYFI